MFVKFHTIKKKILLFLIGSKTEESTIDFSSSLHIALNNSGLLDNDLENKTFFEIDSKCDSSTMVPKLKEQIENKSLLNHGTWAHYGNAKKGKESERYLFWTSVDTDKVGANKQIPVIISTADGKFYISSSTTARKQKSSAYKPYVAIAPTGNGNSNQYKSYIAGKEPYNTLEDAYKAYADVVKNDYSNYKDTLPQ